MKPAKSVIELWLWGGPSQLETFDPTPDAPVDYNHGLKAIPTNVQGLTVHQWWRFPPTSPESRSTSGGPSSQSAQTSTPLYAP